LHNNLVAVKKKKVKDISIIDLGYNSIKISIYNVYKNGHYSKKDQQQEYVQIGHNLYKNNNKIESQNIERVIKFLNKFKDESKQMKIDTVIPIGTSAVRDADNGKEVIKKIKKNTGFEFNVLSGFEEGFFSSLGAQSVMHIPNGIFFDLGGGSLEMIHIENYKIKKIICLNLGVLRLSEKFVKFDEQLEEETRYKQLEDYLYEHVPTIEQFDLDSSMDTRLVGIGGTIRTLSKFISGIFKISPYFSYNHVILNKKIVNLSNDVFKKLSQDELLNIKLIDQQRSKTITTGSYVIKILMEKLGFDEVLVCPTGLREGILENYLYLNLDKKYRSKKKLIELNYNGLSSIICSNNFDPALNCGVNSSHISHPNPNPNPFDLLGHQHNEKFPLKIISAKVNKIK
jgi:exopolyphosphatase / guanosine-5'-triphosphate,3'-diphosphate pyrophosphatase